jgi:hypothetical protein
MHHKLVEEGRNRTEIVRFTIRYKSFNILDITFAKSISNISVVINYSLKNVQQSLYKIEKIIGYLNGNIIENNIDLLNSSTSFLNGITATYETPSEFSKTYNESISCYRENFYVDVFDISFRINQPSLFDITSKYKIINYQILDDNHSYLLTLQGYEDRNIHYAVLGTDSTIFVSPSSITRTYPNLNFSIS